MSKTKKPPPKTGMKPINSKMNRPVYRSDENTGERFTQLKSFSLEEHIDDKVSATVAQIEWMCEGFYCHIEPDDSNMVYYVWVGPKRKRAVRLLPGEKVKRQKGTHIRITKVEAHRKLRAM